MPVACQIENIAFTIPGFSLAQIFECGQCFRFRFENGGWRGIAGGRLLRAVQAGDTVTLTDCAPEEFDSFWAPYFDLSTDYGAIRECLSADPLLEKTCRYGAGIRILRQEPFETLISFIISQNNHIPRIRGIIERLCETFGEPVEGGFAFPLPRRLASARPEDFSSLRAGFRVKYIIDAAVRVAEGKIRLDGIAQMPYEEAKRELMKIHGVGPKVADCALLFGFHRLEAFPVDVWMKRAMTSFFPDGLPEFALPYAGIAQQYLFHYVREGGGLCGDKKG